MTTRIPGRRITCCLLLAAGTLAVTFAAPALAGEAENRELITAYVEQCLNGDDYDCLERYLLPEKVSAVRKSEQFRRHYFPDLHYRVLEVVADEQRVVAMLEVTGHPEETDPGIDDGAEGEGGRLELREALFYSVRDGKLYDGKLISDRLPVAEALGYVVQAPHEN